MPDPVQCVKSKNVRFFQQIHKLLQYRFGSVLTETGRDLVIGTAYFGDGDGFGIRGKNGEETGILSFTSMIFSILSAPLFLLPFSQAYDCDIRQAA